MSGSSGPAENDETATETPNHGKSKANGTASNSGEREGGQQAGKAGRAGQESRPPRVVPITLDEAHARFRRWLGADYDTDALDAVLAAAAVERLDGDPLWLLVISGSGNAKTETVQALDGIGATVTSTISSQGALLSGTSRKEQTRAATGGLLRKLGDRGLLVIKDVTSILSMNSDGRAEVLSALREVYDGRWERNLGTDGGLSLEWTGRLAVVGAVTTAWDKAHSVIASMGDRFVLVRVDSNTGRLAAGRQAIANTGNEIKMRAELAAAVAGVMVGMDMSGVEVTEQERDALLAAADLVTLARTAVEFDYRRNVISSHAPEMPTRFAKQLAQVVRGSVALGMGRTDALRLAIRCARDSMPPMRLAIVDDLARNPDSTPTEVRKRINKPRSTVDSELQALQMLGVATVDEQASVSKKGDETVRWYYSLAESVRPQALNPETVTGNVSRDAVVPDLVTGNVSRGEVPPYGGSGGSDISGDGDESGASPPGKSDTPDTAGTPGRPRTSVVGKRTNRIPRSVLTRSKSSRKSTPKPKGS